MEEMIDILDENGIKTGKILSRKEVHKQGLWHKIIVVAIIDENNQILMQQRSYKKDTNPGKWDISAAGHVFAGQTPLESAVREISEEVGIEIEEKDLEYILTYKKESYVREDYKDKQIFDCYIAKVKEINMKKIILQESEVADSKLASKEEFRDMVKDGNMVDRPAFYKAIIEYLF